MVMRTDVKRFNAADPGLSANMNRGTLLTLFKAILATGYNSKTANIISISGNIVTLDYGVPHGYALHRVLKLSGNPLLSGEHVVTSVDINTLTIEIENQVEASGTVTTQVAPLGFDLVYEATNVAIYKFNYKGKEKYLRLYETSLYNPYVNPSIGDGFNPNDGTLTGNIYPTDSTATQNPYRWDLGYSSSVSSNNPIPADVFGTAEGFVIAGRLTTSKQQGFVYGVLPWITPFDVLETPVILTRFSGAYNSTQSTAMTSFNMSLPIIGEVHARFNETSSGSSGMSTSDLLAPLGNALPDVIQQFNAVSYTSMIIQAYGSHQVLGYTNAIYRCLTNANVSPSEYYPTGVMETYDVLSGNKIWLHQLASAYRCVVLDPYGGFS